MRKSISLLSLVLFLSVSIFAQSSLNKSFTGIKKIQISTASGDCKLTKATAFTVGVDLQHTFGDSYNPEISQENDRLIIREKFNSNTSRGEATWTISVPDGVEVNFSAGSGALKGSNLAFDLDVKTGSGDISLTQTKGDIRVSSGSGDISIESFGGELKANSGSGNIEVGSSKGELTLNCGSGDIQIMDSEAMISANSGSGNIESSGVALTGSSRFNSGSGDAKVVLASTPKFNISVNSGSGDAILDFNGNAIEGEIVMKANKRDGEINAPFDFDKTEEIEQGHDQINVIKTTKRGSSNAKISVGTGSGKAEIKK